MQFGQLQAMRVARSLVLSGLTAAAAGIAHVCGGGHIASAGGLLFVAVLGGPVVFALSRRSWRFLEVLAFMTAAQVGLHAAMTTLEHAAGGHASHAGHALGHHVAHHVSTGPSTGMVLSHIAATVLLALAVSFGERALAWTLAALLRLVALGLTPSPVFRRLAERIPARPSTADVARQRGCRAPPSLFVLL